MRLSLEDLGDELVIEILCRVPLKYVTQCKCISKRWFYLISNLDFVCRFVSRRLSYKKQQPWTFMYFLHTSNGKSNNIPRLTSMDSVFKSHGFSLSFLPCYQPQRLNPICVLKTFNDLVLCCGEPLYQTVYYICNPLTKQWLALPPPPTCHQVVLVDFICEPYYVEDQKQPFGLVFNAQYKFKVVRIPRLPNLPSMTKLKLEIFSSQTGQWNETELSLQPETLKIGVIKQHAVCNGKLTLLTLGLNGLKIITVGDQFDQCYGVIIPGADMYIRHPFRSLWRLFPCGGHLRITLVSRARGIHASRILHIWELKLCNDVDVGEWELVHKVSFENIASSSEWISNYFLKRTYDDYEVLIASVLGFHPHDMNVMYLNLNCDGSMASYDMQNRSLTLVAKTFLPLFVHNKVFQLMLPLWPTPVPEVSHHQSASSKERVQSSNEAAPAPDEDELCLSLCL